MYRVDRHSRDEPGHDVEKPGDLFGLPGSFTVQRT